MRKLAMLIPLLAASPAFAMTPDEIGAQATKCWKIPAGLTKAPDFSFYVTLDATGGVQDVIFAGTAPRDKAKLRAIAEAMKAINGCGPYKGAAAGLTRVRMQWQP
jgi:hypothetical protein